MITARSEFTKEMLKELLCYSPDTGVFTWAKDVGQHGRKGKEVKGITKDNYLTVKLEGTNYAVHRLAWLYVYGKFPDDQIDHINHDRKDNRILNLRSVTRAENNKNVRLRYDNKSGYHGVVWHKTNERWVAVIGVNRAKISLGSFIDKNDAIEARKAAEIKYGFHKNHGLACKYQSAEGE